MPFLRFAVVFAAPCCWFCSFCCYLCCCLCSFCCCLWGFCCLCCTAFAAVCPAFFWCLCCLCCCLCCCFCCLYCCCCLWCFCCCLCFFLFFMFFQFFFFCVFFAAFCAAAFVALFVVFAAFLLFLLLLLSLLLLVVVCFLLFWRVCCVFHFFDPVSSFANMFFILYFTFFRKNCFSFCRSIFIFQKLFLTRMCVCKSIFYDLQKNRAPVRTPHLFRGAKRKARFLLMRSTMKEEPYTEPNTRHTNDFFTHDHLPNLLGSVSRLWRSAN